MSTVSVYRPQRIRDLVLRRDALSRLTSTAAVLVAQERRHADHTTLEETRWMVLEAGRVCQRLECSREEIEAAIARGGLLNEPQQEYLMEVSEGLPPDLQAKIRGG